MRGVVTARDTLIGLATASERFRAIAAYLRLQPGVTSVTLTCWLLPRSTDGDPTVSAEWYTDGEFDNGRALDFGLELAWSGSEWTLVPTIRVTHAAGQDNLVDLPTSHAVEEDDMLRELSVACELLVTAQDQAVRSFKEWRA
jgi:hypothetical protein